jgi:hypothetical protein
LEVSLNRILLAVIISACVCVGAKAQTQSPIRVLCGDSSTYTDSKGQVWQADNDYNDGRVSSNTATIANTPDPTLYHFGRVNQTVSKPLQYTFPVSNGNYHVNLYFAETTPAEESAGARVFNVRMQGQLIFSNLDIFATVGADTPLIDGTDISVTNGQLQIEFDNIVQNAKINAIEVIQTSTTPELHLNFTYSDGTPVAGNLVYTVTSSQVNLSGTAALQNGAATCNLYASPSALGLSGTFQVNLSLQDGSGNTLWQVTLSMDPSAVNIASVQTSTLNVTVQKASS